MENITEALAMGQYGMYVWPAFIIAAFIIIIMLILSLRSLRRAQKTLSELQKIKSGKGYET
jgi:heme exporter protein CcmD